MEAGIEPKLEKRYTKRVFSNEKDNRNFLEENQKLKILNNLLLARIKELEDVKGTLPSRKASEDYDFDDLEIKIQKIKEPVASK